MVDIAKRSGVSVATVSKYLSGGSVRPRNRENIARAIDELGYRINETARALKTDRTMTVGIIMDSLSNMFYTSVLSIMEKQFNGAGYSSIICETGGRSEAALEKLELMRSKRVDGLVYFTSSCGNDFTDRAERAGVKLVVVDSLPPGPAGRENNSDFVFTDNLDGSRLAAEYLIRSGHRDVAVITGEDRHFSARERLAGFAACFEKSGFPLTPENILRDSYDMDGGYRAAKALAARPALPTAVMVCNCLMNLGAVIAFHEDNIKIGGDISLVSFDELRLNRAFQPPLATVGQSLTEIGETAAGLIISKMRGENKPPGIYRIPAYLNERESVIHL